MAYQGVRVHPKVFGASVTLGLEIPIVAWVDDVAFPGCPTHLPNMDPPLGLDTVGNLLRITAENTRKKQFQFLRQLKLSLYEAIQVHALQYLQSRVSLQLLPGGVSWAWLTHLATVLKLAVNGLHALLSCGGQ